MFADTKSLPLDSSYPYSDELRRLLEFGASVDIHPIYVIGLTQQELHAMRNAYSNPESMIRVGIYGIYDINALVDRIGIAPTVVVLAEHIRITGVVSDFIKKHRVPVLRLQENPVHLCNLGSEDFYGGVYETMDSKHITNSDEVTYMLNLGIMVWWRTHGKIEQHEVNLNNMVPRTIDPKATTSIKNIKPESSWEAFASKQMNGFVPTIQYEEAVKTIDSSFTFRNTDSSFELTLDT